MTTRAHSGRRECVLSRLRSRRVEGFTVVEISVAAFILALVFMMAFTFFGTETKGLAHLGEDLEINAKIEAAFSQISRDIRASSRVHYPLYTKLEDAPPKFEHKKNDICVLEQVVPDYRSVPFSKTTSIVRYWLGSPEPVGETPGGPVMQVHNLYRKVDKDGKDSAPPKEPLLTGIEELVFYRTEYDPAKKSGPNGTGAYVVHIRMKVSAVRSSNARKYFRGYAAEMDTMVKLRGSL